VTFSFFLFSGQKNKPMLHHFIELLKEDHYIVSTPPKKIFTKFKGKERSNMLMIWIKNRNILSVTFWKKGD